VNFSPRHLIRSRPGRVLAWLAWLVLAVSPLQSGPSGDWVGMSHHAHAAAVNQGHAHTVTAAAHDCCAPSHGLPLQDACHCASMCASTLPAMALARLDRVAPAAPLVALHAVHAPRGVHSRLLRPPAA
jgi:hypothetical protein